MSAVWSAPHHPEPLRSSVRIPGSKSLTNRYFVLAALGDQPSVIREPLVARDTILMAQALESMGAGLEFYDDALFVYPAPLHGATIQAGLAGTVMRFLPAVAMLAKGDVTIDGDASANLRASSRSGLPVSARNCSASSSVSDAGSRSFGILPLSLPSDRYGP